MRQATEISDVIIDAEMNAVEIAQLLKLWVSEILNEAANTAEVDGATYDEEGRLLVSIDRESITDIINRI